MVGKPSEKFLSDVYEFGGSKELRENIEKMFSI